MTTVVEPASVDSSEILAEISEREPEVAEADIEERKDSGVETSAGATSTPVASEVRSSENEPVLEESLMNEPDAVAELGGPPGGEMAKKESEMAATTAAAWANWRQIRETGDPRAKAPAAEDAKAEEPREAAAMAVAAGAENRPTDAEEAESEADPEAIASIVDSVLAQMRPKIVEEITRKMGKKK
jgi:hypothetical protein